MVSKSWCFTLNNYSEEDVTFFQNLDVSYIIFGKEVSQTGTPHLQGFLTLRTAHRLSGLKKIHSKAHWEIAKSKSHSITYCKKEGDYFVKDNRKKPGRPRKQSSVRLLERPPPITVHFPKLAFFNRQPTKERPPKTPQNSDIDSD